MTREERENAIKVIKNYDLNFFDVNKALFSPEEIANAFDCALEVLEQEQKTDVPDMNVGRWIPVTNGRGGHKCDQCNEYAPSYQNGDEYLSKYCPRCGIKMECKMTIEEVKSILQHEKLSYTAEGYNNKRVLDAYDIAIKALEQYPDYPQLSHSEITGLIYVYFGDKKFEITKQAIEAVEAIKALDPEPKIDMFSQIVENEDNVEAKRK